MNAGPLLAVTALCGIVSGLLGSAPPAGAAALAIGAASLALLVDARRMRAGVLLVGVFFGAVADGALARDRALHAPLALWFGRVTSGTRLPDVVRIHGTLVEDAALAESGVRLLIDVDAVDTPRMSQPLSGRVQATVSGSLGPAHLREWTAHRRIAAPILLRSPQVWRNPGSPGERWQRLHRTADLVGTIKSAALVEIAPGRWWDEIAALIRRHVRESARRFAGRRSSGSAAIVTAVLIGDQAGLDEDVRRRLQLAGTYHTVVISGAHVAVLTAVSFVLLRLLVRSFRGVAAATAGIVIGYGWLVGNQPSVNRAVTAATIYLAVGCVGLRPPAINVLAVTAMGLAVVSPAMALDAGAWLSFGATLGIVVGATRFSDWATRRGVAGARTRGGVLRSAARRVWNAVLGVISATVAAELVLLPLSAALFARIGPLGLVLNLVAIPAISIVQLAGTLMAALTGSWNGAARACGWLAGLAASWLIGSSRAVDLAPWLVWRTPPVSIAWTVAYYAGLVLALFPGRSRWRRAAALATSCSLIVILTAPGLARAAPAGGRLRLSVLDVGQGDAMLVQFPDGHTMLVDAGGLPTGTFDVGDRVVAPALWALGVRRLDWLVLTHGDVDHAGGAAGVERDFRPREILGGHSGPATSAPVEPAGTGPHRPARLAAGARRPLARARRRDDARAASARAGVGAASRSKRRLRGARHPVRDRRVPAGRRRRPRVRADVRPGDASPASAHPQGWPSRQSIGQLARVRRVLSAGRGPHQRRSRQRVRPSGPGRACPL